MPESNRRHQAPEACALSAELIARCHDEYWVYGHRHGRCSDTPFPPERGAKDIRHPVLVNTTCRGLSRDVCYAEATGLVVRFVASVRRRVEFGIFLEILGRVIIVDR